MKRPSRLPLTIFSCFLFTLPLAAQEGLTEYLDILQQAQAATNQNTSNTQNNQIAERYAELVSELAEARRKNDPQERLEAIEAVLERYEIGHQVDDPSEPYVFQETQGAWGADLIEEVPGEGTSLYLALQAAVGTGVNGGPIYLVVAKPADQDLVIYIKWSSYFRELPVVEYKWGREDWIALPQVLSRTKQSTYLEEDFLGFLEKLRENERLIVRTLPFASRTLIAEFQLTGFAYLYDKYESYLQPTE